MAKQGQLRQGTKTEHDSFTGAVGEVTVDTTANTLRVHDGATVGGHVITKNTDVRPVSFGGTGANTAAAARTNLGLGTAATKNEITSPIDATAGRVLTVGAFGLGGNAEEARFSAPKQTGFWAASSSEANPYPFPAYGSSIRVNRNATVYAELFLPYVAGDRGNAVGVRSVYGSSDNYQIIYSSANPIVYDTQYVASDKLVTVSSTGFMRSIGFTIDSNGFLKNASPIIKLFADKIELNDEAQQQEITFEKLGVGDYLIKGSTGLAQEGWYVEQPRDANGNIYHAVVHEQLESGDISVKTYECKLNEIGQTVADLEKPIDIKENRFISIRLNELPQDTTAPQNPNVIDTEGNPAPSKYHYLENGEWKITAENEAILENERYAAYQASLRPLTRRQFKLALLENGLLDQIENLISAIEDSNMRARIQIEYAESTEFHRTSDSVAYMCQLLGLTNEQVDQMWEQAMNL